MKFVSLITLFFIVFSLSAQKQKTLYFDQNWLPSQTASRQFYFCECTIAENDWLQGAFNCYALKNEELVKQYNFLDNKLDGEVFEYFLNGNVKLQATYSKGLPVGDWKEWNISGELITHKTFDDSNRILKDYFSENTFDYKMPMGINQKKEEAPIYTSECMLKKQENEKYRCSDEALLKYYLNPPLPPNYLPKGTVLKTILKYELSYEAMVIGYEIITTSGDDFLDELAGIHVLNMVPFEAAKKYGTPVNFWLEAEITFRF